jgi:hypothetical protein
MATAVDSAAASVVRNRESCAKADHLFDDRGYGVSMSSEFGGAVEFFDTIPRAPGIYYIGKNLDVDVL